MNKRKIFKLGITLIVIIGVFLLGMYFLSLLSPISDGGWEKHGDVLFMNLKDKNFLIVRQEYETGAWDTETTRRIVKLNLQTGKTEAVDTSKLIQDQWIQIIPSQNIWRSNSVGTCLGPERFKLFINESKEKGRLIFQHKELKDFSKIINPLESYSQLMPNWRTYSNNSFSEKFRAFVFCKYSSLVLYTIDNDNSRIGKITLYHESKDVNYLFKKYAIFTDPNKFQLIINYRTFKPDNQSKPIQSSMKEIEVINTYEITNDGQILKTNNEEFGKVIIKN